MFVLCYISFHFSASYWCWSICIWQVNPIAVNSKYCNVFTENKRVVSIISTSEFGKVCIFALLFTFLKGCPMLMLFRSFPSIYWIVRTGLTWCYSWICQCLLRLIVYQGLSAFLFLSNTNVKIYFMIHLFTVFLRWTDNKVNTAWSLAPFTHHVMTFLVPDGMVQVAFVAIGATMVGSITFLKKEGDYIHKGDEVFFMHFLLIYCDNFFWCLCEGVKLSVSSFLFLSSSLGISPLEGAQWYASSRRFSHPSLLTSYLSILYIQILKRNYCSWNFDSVWQDAIQFDADLVANSERSLETLVSVGMTLGVSTRNKGLQVPDLQKFSLEWLK